jgi:hypothetical protein
VTVADTWDEAACRARLAAYKANASAHDVLQCAWHAPADLQAALAALDAARAECDRLRAALLPFAEFADKFGPGYIDPEKVTSPHKDIYLTLGDFRRAAAALGAARD